MNIFYVQHIPWWLELLKMLAPVSSAFLAGYLVNRYKNREELIERRCDDMCKTLDQLVEIGADYWSKKQFDIEPMIETKILAAQLKMSELRKGLEGFMSKLATDEIIKSEQIFQRTLTGGDFGVHNREPDLERAKIMMVHGRKYENIIRISRLKDSAGLWRR